VLDELKTNLKTGLTQKDAEERVAKYGLNQLEKEEETSLWVRIIESFDDLLVKILLLAALVSFIIAVTGKPH
jgi:Ca2+-transporting ATPase